MNNVLIYFCANVQILIRPGTIVFTKSDLTPDEKRRISPRFDRAPDAGGIFGKYSIHVYPEAPRSQSVHSLPILQPHGRDTLLPFLHTNGLLRFGGQI